MNCLVSQSLCFSILVLLKVTIIDFQGVVLKDFGRIKELIFQGVSTSATKKSVTDGDREASILYSSVQNCTSVSVTCPFYSFAIFLTIGKTNSQW